MHWRRNKSAKNCIDAQRNPRYSQGTENHRCVEGLNAPNRMDSQAIRSQQAPGKAYEITSQRIGVMVPGSQISLKRQKHKENDKYPATQQSDRKPAQPVPTIEWLEHPDSEFKEAGE